MIPIPPLSYAQIESICQELQGKVIGYQINACFSLDSKRLIFILEKQADKQVLFFCFEVPLIRLHLLSPLPKTSQLPHHPLHHYLRGMKISKINTVNNDRIVLFELSSEEKNYFLISEFFSKHPNCYLIDSAYTILFSLYPTKQPVYHFPLPREGSAHVAFSLLTSAEMMTFYANLEEQWKFQQEKQALEKGLDQELKKTIHKKKQLEKALEACRQWESVQHEGDLIKAHLGQFKKGQKQMEVWDWLTNQSRVITLDLRQSIQEEMAARYKQARKLQKGAIPIQQQLARLEERLSFLKTQQGKLPNVNDVKGLFDLRSLLEPTSKSIKKRTKTPLTVLPYYEYHSEAGIPILVGKNAKANDKLTFQLASGNDWWLHAHGVPGSHVVIKLSKGSEPDPETLQDAIQLALLHSKAEVQGEGEVCVTQKKYVSRFGKDKTGKVQISKHKLVYARLNKEYCKIIKSRKKPQASSL